MENTTDSRPERLFYRFLREAVPFDGHVQAFPHPLDGVASLSRPKLIPPEHLAYFQKLRAALVDGRRCISIYNYALLAILGVLTVLHFVDRRRCRRRWQSKTAVSEFKGGEQGPDFGLDASGSASGASPSSSASSSPRITTPSGALKDSHIDIERLPLLGLTRSSDHGKLPSILIRSAAQLTAWLEYQPRPLPLVNKVLPSNGTSLFIALWLAINLVFLFYRLPLGLEFTLPFAARSGDVFIANLPLLYLLAAKNQPVKLLTGLSYEALNIFHRRVGEWMCFHAFIHSVGEVLWRMAPGFAPDWFGARPGLWAYLLRPIIYYGLGAFAAYELLYLTSLGSFRQRWYELFLASHVVLQTLALWFLYKHVHIARPWVMLSLAIFLVDRLVWRLGLKSTTVDADLEVLPDGQTIVLVAHWARPIAPSSSWGMIWPRQNIRHGWAPTDHVFLTVPALGRRHRLQAHPFTIASAAPGRAPTGPHTSSGDGAENQVHTTPQITLTLLIRAQQGFTAALLQHARRHRTVSVRLDGPYGSTHALDMLRAADNAVLVAGGSGIAVTLPLAWALLKEQRREGSSRAVRMLWVIHRGEHHRWVPKEVLDELVAAGLDLVVPRPTSEAGRPDVAGYVEEWIEESPVAGLREAQSAVVVSGPDGLNRMVRNTCALAIGRGIDIRLAVEKFGW